MKRVGNIFSEIVSIDNLMSAYYKASKGKHCKTSVISYMKNLYENILRLRTELLNGEFEIGRYHYFKVYDPKERVICAASFEERVVHHAIMNVCHRYFERHLIHDTYATRKGKGIYAAMEKAQKGMRKYNYVAKLDVRKYFDSISHSVLKIKLARLFKDKELLNLLYGIIDSYSVKEDTGIPIGNLTSQYFANFYLSFLDHYAKENLKIPVYVRYMDDILLFGCDKNEVKNKVVMVKRYIAEELRLELKPEVLLHTNSGVSFLGYSIYKNKILLSRRSKIRFKKKMIKYDFRRESGEWGDMEYMAHIIPLMAFAQKAYTKGLRKDLCRKLYS